MSDTPLVRDSVVEVSVRALSSNGSGVADLPDGKVCFVPRTAPGDRVRIRLGKVKARWAQAELEEVLEHGPDRVDAPCRAYGECGGCALQHVHYDEQLTWKGRFIADALQRIGGLTVEAPVVTASPNPLGYRNRVTYTLRRLRAGRVVAGFHALGRPAHVIDIQAECLLPEPSLKEAWTRIRNAWGSGARRLPDAGRLRLTLRTGDEGVTLVVEGGEVGWNAKDLGDIVPGLRAIWHQPQKSRRPQRVWGESTTEQWDDETVRVTGRAFLQVNRGAASLLETHVLEQVGTPESAVDAYAGVGRYARALARNGAAVQALELDADACDVCREDAPLGLEVLKGDVAALLPDVLPTDLLVLNPPRTGLGPEVPEAILRTPPPRIVYVSCDPATLARDLSALTAGGYSVADVAAFDLFPQTAHVETVVSLDHRPESA